MLIGEFEHSLDAKGRLIMPAKLKSAIGDRFIVTKRFRWLFVCVFTRRMEKLRRKN